jgi:flagellar motor switch protein FliM
MELTAELAEIALRMEEVDELEVGDLLVTDDGPETTRVVVRLGGVPRHRGRLAEADGKRAIIIDGHHEPPQSPTQPSA